MFAADIRYHLRLLELERLEADATGLTTCERYMRDLEDEMAACRRALVALAVTEIALSRATVYGRLTG